MSALLDALGYVGETLGKPGAAVRGLLAGRPDQLMNLLPFSDTLGLTDPTQRTTGRDLLQGMGLVDERSGDGFDMGDVAGFGADIATDPLAYLGGAGAGHLVRKLFGGRAAAEALPEVVDLAGASRGVSSELPTILANNSARPTLESVLERPVGLPAEMAHTPMPSSFEPGAIEQALAGKVHQSFPTLVEGNKILKAEVDRAIAYGGDRDPEVMARLDRAIGGTGEGGVGVLHDNLLRWLGEQNRNAPVRIKWPLDQQPIRGQFESGLGPMYDAAQEAYAGDLHPNDLRRIISGAAREQNIQRGRNLMGPVIPFSVAEEQAAADAANNIGRMIAKKLEGRSLGDSHWESQNIRHMLLDPGTLGTDINFSIRAAARPEEQALVEQLLRARENLITPFNPQRNMAQHFSPIDLDAAHLYPDYSGFGNRESIGPSRGIAY